ncbi:MAG: hypothetical protein KDI49_08680, partial [Gammaproteobacteria bacterium]|nr:hypothetical protein [Gammaproteobacteria bacterium]
MKQRNEPAENQASQLIAGVHTVRTLLNRSAFSVVELWVEPQRRDQRINEIVTLAEKSGIRVTQAAREQLD